MTLETSPSTASQGRELEGRVALITGGSRNIGRAIALDLARAGASVMVAARSDRAGLDEVVAAVVSGGGKAASVLADVTRPEDAARMVEAARSTFGRLDILVNNAAVRNEAPFAQLEYGTWREIMAVALDGPFLCAKAALPELLRSDQATVVNIGGLTAYTGAAHRVHVVAAKAGLDGFTKALAHDLAPHKITVNLVSPGLIATVRAGAQPHHHGTTANLTGRRGTPEEVAAMVRFLCGPGARYVTGQTMHVNGGAYLP